MSEIVGRKRTAPWVAAQKGKAKIVCVTAYDAPSASIADAAGVDVVLVGDSVGNAVLGYQDTLSVTLDMIEHHTRAVRHGVSKALLVADMPLGSYGASVGQAVESAVRLVRAGAEAVKLEGRFTDEIAAISKIGIPVMGHLGMTPQSKNKFGGIKAQGKHQDQADEIASSLKSIEAAGVFATVLELIPSELAGRLTVSSTKPTIGIGSGPNCDGEIQVWHDILGLSPQQFRHTRKFADIGNAAESAVAMYAKAVRDGTFPGPENSL